MTPDTVVILPHTHWDREWYLPFEQFRGRLVRVVDRVLAIMQADPTYERFTLDGQSIVVADYLAIRPEREAAVRELVRSGRLAIGPWYVLPDEFLVSGEALIRNLDLGRRYAAGFGEPMATGYLPDSFGHIAQLPQILRGFGIDGAMLSRGIGDEGERLGSEFWWEALDGSRVLCVHQVRGYCNLVALGYRNPSDLFEERPPDPDLAVDRVQDEVARLQPYARCGMILLNNGCDHQPPSPHLPALITRLREVRADLTIRWATPDEVIREILARRPRLESWRGELRGSRYAPLIPGVLSTRIYLKQANEAAQTALERWAEPMAAIAWALGEPEATPFLRHAWQLLLENHPHDSISGCSVDAVHREMLPRFARVQEIAEAVTHTSLRAIAGRVDTQALPTGLPLVVVNALHWPRTEPVRIGVSLTPRQARRLTLVDAARRLIAWQREENRTEVLARERIAANRLAQRLWWLSHEVELAWGVRFADFTVSGDRLIIHTAEAAVAPEDLIPRVVKRLAGRRRPIRVQVQRLRLELVFLASDVPALGYRIFVLTPTARGKPATSPPPVAVRGTTVSNGRVKVRLFPDGTVTVHDGAGTMERGHVLEDAGDAGDEYDHSPVDDPPILSTGLRGRAEVLSAGPVEARLRVRLPLRLPTGLRPDRRYRERRRADCSVEVEVVLRAASSRVEFSTTVDNRVRDHRLRVRFPTSLSADRAASDVEFGTIERPLRQPSGAGWAQPPQPTAPHRSWVDVSDGTRGVAVIAPGLHEHEILPGRDGLTVAVTLLRAVGWLSRDDLRTRAAHAGPGYETPEAQGLGVHRYAYAVLSHRGTWREADLAREALAFRVPLRAFPTTRHPGRLPPVHSFLRCDGAVISALQGPDAAQGLLLRVYNPSPGEATAVITPSLPVNGAREVTLAGETVDEIAPAGSVIRVRLKPFQIQTLRLHLASSPA